MTGGSFEVCEQSMDLRFACFVGIAQFHEIIQSRFGDKRDAFVGWNRGRELEGSACADIYESSFETTTTGRSYLNWAGSADYVPPR